MRTPGDRGRRSRPVAPIRWRVDASRHHGQRGWRVYARSGPDQHAVTHESRWCTTEAEARSLKASLDRGLTIDAAHAAWAKEHP